MLPLLIVAPLICLYYYLKLEQMGNDPPQSQQPVQPKPINQTEEEEDIYILEPLATLSLKAENRSMHFWIDPKIFSGENQKYENFFKQALDLEGFSSVEGFMNELSTVDTTKKIKVICAASLQEDEYKRLQADARIFRMYLFCQNQERAKLLMSNFQKIKTAKYDAVELREFLIHEQSSGDGADPKINLLLTIEEDTNLMNKYRINFHSLTSCKAKLNAKADFVNFARKLFNSKVEEINEFEKNYKLNLSSTESARQTLYWLGKGGFFWESTQALPKITTDPKKLAYLRFPFKEAYNGILKQYRDHPKYLSEVFVVMTPTEDELAKLKKNLSNYLFFTSFIKGYTSEKVARSVLKKTPHSYLVRVMTKLPPKICNELDFGYYTFQTTEADEPDVVFNIYNVFQILQFEEDEFTFQYGSLAEVAYIREKERKTRLGPFQENLIRNYDYLQDIISRIDSQATILQMSGHFEDSLLIHSQKLEQIRKSQPSQEVLDKHTIDLGDAYRINEEYSKAQQQYLSVKQGKMALIANVHLAELYFKTKESSKLKNVIEELQKNIAKYKEISQPDSFKAQNYIGIELINKGKYKQASRLYKNLSSEIGAYYDFKFEGIPLVHDIIRNRALCETKLNNFTEALNLLDSTKLWQRICEGNKSPGLIITQNLIKSVHQSRGETEQVYECQEEVKKIQQSALKEENFYLSRNAVMPESLNESLVCLQISNFTQNPPVSGKERSIEQSTINIEL